LREIWACKQTKILNIKLVHVHFIAAECQIYFTNEADLRSLLGGVDYWDDRSRN